MKLQKYIRALKLILIVIYYHECYQFIMNEVKEKKNDLNDIIKMYKQQKLKYR